MYSSKSCIQRNAGSSGTAGILVIAFFLICSCAAEDKYAGYEYEPGEGLHQEEWYDPGDWFDTGEGIDYEEDWEKYYYGHEVYQKWRGYPQAKYYPYDPHDFHYPEPWTHDPVYRQFYSEQWNGNDLFEGDEGE